MALPVCATNRLHVQQLEQAKAQVKYIHVPRGLCALAVAFVLSLCLPCMQRARGVDPMHRRRGSALFRLSCSCCNSSNACAPACTSSLHVYTHRWSRCARKPPSARRLNPGASPKRSPKKSARCMSAARTPWRTSGRCVYVVTFGYACVCVSVCARSGVVFVCRLCTLRVLFFKARGSLPNKLHITSQRIGLLFS